jgi:uncharacterized protein (DUF1697 family)
MEHMDTYISLLRGINVSGQKKIPMDELKAIYESLGYHRVTTYIQSGNVVFDAQGGGLAGRIEQAIEKQYGFEVPVVLRSVDEFADIIEGNPFLKEFDVDSACLHVVFLSESPAAAALDKLASIESGADQYRVAGSEIYLYCPNGYGRTKLSNTVLEKKLAVSATTRNWKTVNQLYRIARPQ